MENFTPVSALIGGIIIGFACIGLLYDRGRLCGASLIFNNMWFQSSQQQPWRLQFIFGLIFGGLMMGAIFPDTFDSTLAASFPMVCLGGFLVGFGTQFGHGCTSGHGICGIGRFRMRSIVATLIFMIFGMITATFFRSYIEAW